MFVPFSAERRLDRCRVSALARSTVAPFSTLDPELLHTRSMVPPCLSMAAWANHGAEVERDWNGAESYATAARFQPFHWRVAD